ncbi:hypothetical protein CS063_04485 [Sporanaerobium hydrogeniformans]|uniref:Uncharacterized protein n=1 Tax=Sporanaerobium hydrogeniformans TaxID=3072179 RepID=A0AC61DEW0_9FIRM|nr:hypothetical protein [Sporanaerobium hydrogeniformans]PHV71819.1 hypothetical protein CS063_04485 [Sporanaerobium hydrogeniformans]
MIRQAKNYIQKQKKKYLLWTIVWGLLMASVFAIGILVTKNRGNYFTLVAGLLILPMAINFTRLTSFIRFKDGQESDAKLLEGMKGSYILFHSAIIPDTRTTVLFEHIVVTARSIYFLTTRKEIVAKNKEWIKQRLMAKGLEEKALHFVCLNESNTLKNTVNKMEKDACYTGENLENYAHIIQGMLM